ncbi:MAG: hypothetical protein E7080_09270 [Bacteroidales bacterium]|nr:hypothetical protein [Bacteroidales bacterium]
MLNKIFKWAFLPICILFASCSNDSFTIEGVITDLGELPVKAYYVNEAGVQSLSVPSESGRFKLEGVSQNYTMVQLYNSKNELITKVIMKNGESLKLKGNIKHKYLIEMKGSDVNEDWNNFRRANHTNYSEGEYDIIDKKIEEYIEANSNNIVSTVLLLFDYNNLDDSDNVRKLFNSINEEARPASLMKAYVDINALKSTKKDNNRKWHTIKLYNENDSLESFMPLKGKLSLLYFCGQSDENRKNIIEALDTLYYNYKHTPKGKTQLQIADIMLDSDTVSWKRTLRSEDTDWEHFWAVGGTMHPTISDMLVNDAPYFIMLDSVGGVVYRGESIDSASHIINARLVKMSEKEKAKERAKKKKAQDAKKEKQRKERQRIFNANNKNKKKDLKTF